MTVQDAESTPDNIEDRGTVWANYNYWPAVTNSPGEMSHCYGALGYTL